MRSSFIWPLVALPLSVHALDTTMYGQVNKNLLAYDDGQSTDYTITDNDLSSTRLGLKGEQKLDNGLTASFMLEMEMQSNPSNLLTQNNASGNSSVPLPTNNSGVTNGAVGFDERISSVGLSGNFGGVVLGQIATATDSILTRDLSGVQNLMTADYRKIGGGLNLRTSTGNLSGVSINSLTSDINIKRSHAIRYDSPKLMGLQAKASIAQGGDTEAALLYEHTFGALQFDGATAIEFNNDTSTASTNAPSQRLVASGSVRHSSGLAATMAYSADNTRNSGPHTPEEWYAKLGYAWGPYELAADYGYAGHYGNTTLPENNLTTLGVGGQLNMGNGVSVAALYRNFSASRTGTNLQNIDLLAANLRVKF